MIRKLKRLFLRCLCAFFILSVSYCVVTLINVVAKVPSYRQDVEMLKSVSTEAFIVDAIESETISPHVAHSQDTKRGLLERNPHTVLHHLNRLGPGSIAEELRAEEPHEFTRKDDSDLLRTSMPQRGEHHVQIKESTRKPGPLPSHDCVAQNLYHFPLCKIRFQEFNTTWKEECHQKKFGVNASDPCSVLIYLSEVERWCPPFPWRNVQSKEKRTSRTEDAEIRRNISGLIELFDRGHFAWLRDRSKVMWPEWMDALDSLSRKRNFLGRRKKSILIYMGSFVVNPFFFEQAFTGGPQGELVQWSDVIATLYILGHDLVIAVDESEITRENDPVVTHPEGGCAATNFTEFYDLIFTDIPGTTTIRYHTGPNFSRYKCKLRILDTFGTEAEFNYKYYKEKLKGGRSVWADLNVNLQQFMTMYPHTPDNLFIGFSVPHKSMPNERRSHADEKTRGLVYGKRPSYFNGKKHYLDIFHKFMEIHGNIGEDQLESSVPDYVIDHGIVNGSILTNLLKQSKIFIGLGFPYEGPAPLDAIANGCFYVNPKLKTPLNRENVYFFHDKPTFRKIYSQNPYAEDFIGKPFVHTINIENDTEVENTIQEILRSTETPRLPYEFTHEGMLERVNAFVQNLEFCTEHQWPPLQELLTVVSSTGQSCKDTCFKKGLLCEPSFFRHLNTAKMLRSVGMECSSHNARESLVAPSLNETDNSCVLQDQPLLFSCVASHQRVIRLCPCRRFQKEQVALCPNCR